MALQKSISLGNSGVTATYWVIASVHMDFESNRSTVVLSGYVDSQHKIDGYGPVMKKTITWAGEENPITLARVQNGTAFSAAMVKATAAQTNILLPANPFEGATIVA